MTKPNKMAAAFSKYFDNLGISQCDHILCCLHKGAIGPTLLFGLVLSEHTGWIKLAWLAQLVECLGLHLGVCRFDSRIRSFTCYQLLVKG